jgi:hypothetical protein
MGTLDWEELDPSAAGLGESRLVLHHAIQPVAAVGETLAPRAADDSQQGLSVRARRSWVGATVGGGRLRGGIDPVALELQLCDGAGTPLASLPLAGRTLADALAFMRAELERRGQPPAGLALPTHPPDFPHHPLADGARFPEGGEGGRDELARLFAGTRALLREALGEKDAPIWLWPHHFDLAGTTEIGAVSVGLGVSPGDGASGRPYWYATLSPSPPRDRLPPLAGGGSWHLTGWTGAELPLERLRRGAAGQRDQVREFFLSALAAARR